MTKRDCKPSNPSTPSKPPKAIEQPTVEQEQGSVKQPATSSPPLSTQLTHLCDELHDATAMHYFFYDAVEAITQDASNSMSHVISHDGLRLWVRHLRECDQRVNTSLTMAQRSARSGV